MTSPLVSVIIPAYNAERWLPETIDSVIAQTHPALEVIVVDDGSTDRTLMVAQECMDLRVRALRQSNAGPGSARNHGLRHARGKYIQFLDADDLLSPDKIARGVARLEAAGDDACFAHSRWCRFAESISDVAYHDEPSFRDLDGLTFMIESLHGRGMQSVGTWLVPRTLIDRVGPWRAENRSPIEDGEYLFRLCAQARMLFADGMLYYRTGHASMSRGRQSARAATAIYESFHVMTDTLLARSDAHEARHAAAAAWQTYVYDNYIAAPRELLRDAQTRIRTLGGAPDVQPGGGPRFHRLRRVVGWRAARHVEALYHRTGASLT